MSIPQKMKAVQIVEYNKPYCVREVDVPQPQDLEPHQVLVKIAVASFCHTDEMVRMASMDKEFDVKLPCTGSHEGAGTVAAAGPSVDKFKVGQRVLCSILEHVDGNEAKQYPQYCSVKFGTPGITRDGMFTEYVVVDSRTAAHLPEGVSFEVAAPLACAGCTVWRGIKQAGLKPGRWLALVGSGGGLGHIGVRFAKELGYKVIGVDARDEGLEMTKRAGADLVLDARNGGNGLVDALARATGRGGADATVNISEAETAAATACAITRAHGLMVQIAQPEYVNIPFAQLVFCDVRIIGSLISTPEEMQDMVDFVAEHKIDVEVNVFKGLDAIDALVDFVPTGKMLGKAVITV